MITVIARTTVFLRLEDFSCFVGCTVECDLFYLHSGDLWFVVLKDFYFEGLLFRIGHTDNFSQRDINLKAFFFNVCYFK